MKKPLFRDHILTVSISILAIIIAAASSRTRAAEQRHHDAHVHGIAHLNAAMEDTNLHLEFTSPAANIVGFEHQPRTQEQKDAVRKAMKKLQDGSKLFITSPEAQCRLSKSSVKTDIEHEGEHDAKREHENEHARHSEFEAEYRFVCQHLEKLSQADVMLIQAFPGIEHIEVQLLTGTKQSAQQLTQKKNVLKF